MYSNQQVEHFFSVFLFLFVFSVELDSVEGELESLEVQIAELQKRQKHLTRRRDALLQKLDQACDAAQPSSSSKSKSTPSASVMSKQELQRYDRAGTGKTRWLCRQSLCHVMTSI